MLRYGFKIDPAVRDEHRRGTVSDMLASGISYSDAMLCYDLSLHAVTTALEALDSVAMRAPDKMQSTIQTLALITLAGQMTGILTDMKQQENGR